MPHAPRMPIDGIPCSMNPATKSKNLPRTIACGVLLAFALAGGARANLTDAQKREVVVTLTQNTASEFVVTVDHLQQRYRFATVVPDFESPAEGLTRQRALMGWKGEYLFVRHQCGQIARWRCTVDQIFVREKNRLRHLGAVESGACAELGCRYQPTTGVFVDLYDIYQVNPVTGATDSPPLPIARRHHHDGLQTDLDATWAMNQPAYLASLHCLNAVAQSGFAQPCERDETPWGALVFAAKLTHYTGRTQEREALFDNQAVSYCKKSADTRCQWRVNGLKDYFQRFLPGAAPNNSPSPVTLTTPTEVQPKAFEMQKLEMGKAIPLKF